MICWTVIDFMFSAPSLCLDLYSVLLSSVQNLTDTFFNYTSLNIFALRHLNVTLK